MMRIILGLIYLLGSGGQMMIFSRCLTIAAETGEHVVALAGLYCFVGAVWLLSRAFLIILAPEDKGKEAQ